MRSATPLLIIELLAQQLKRYCRTCRQGYEDDVLTKHSIALCRSIELSLLGRTHSTTWSERTSAKCPADMANTMLASCFNRRCRRSFRLSLRIGAKFASKSR